MSGAHKYSNVQTGASGARIILRSVHNMRLHDDKYGVASLCIGGGQGGAMLLERIAS